MGITYQKQEKPHNAICTWCSQFDVEQRFCYAKQSVIQDWTLPRRCIRYDGPPVEGKNLNKIMETLK